MRVIVGVDEAGRGPIAGPVTVAAVALLIPFDRARLGGVKDSKQISEKKREEYRSVVEALAAEGALRFAVHSTAPAVIDAQGIVYAIKKSLSMVLEELELDAPQTLVQLDGSLKAPERFVHQETIVKGDETELPITLAGIMAKTTRDREMERLAVAYPEYSFETHKGYGTKGHYRALKEHGLCTVHRASFIHLTKDN